MFPPLLETLPLAYSGVDFASGEVEVGVVEEKFPRKELLRVMKRNKYKVEKVEKKYKLLNWCLEIITNVAG